MARIALYRKYRPATFDELVGQEHVQTIFKNSIKSGKISHAYIFCGPRGVGKTSVARILAKAINCENQKDGNPCNECDSCKSINNQTALDIIEIDAASNRGIDEIRDLREKIKFGPSELKKKVFIIDEVHMLTKEAFNALLKTLEEPPSHAIFVLATTEIHKIPATVISRCQRFDFKRISDEELGKRLEFIAAQEKVNITEDARTLIAKTSEGGMRDAISIFDQISTSHQGNEISSQTVRTVLGVVGEEATENIIHLIEERNKKEALVLVDRLVNKGIDISQLTKNLLDQYRVRLKQQATNDQDLTGLIMKIDILAECFRNFRYSVFPQLSLEVAILKIIGSDSPLSRPASQSEKIPSRQDSEVQTVEKEELTVAPGSPKMMEKWPQVLFEIKTKNLPVNALVKVAEPSFSDEEIHLTFPFKFHRERIDDRKNKEVVEKAVKKIYGRDFRIVCALGKGNHVSEIIETPPKEKEKAVEPSTATSALDIFGGEIIE